MVWTVWTVVISLCVSDVAGFYGGCMSYTSSIDESTNHLKIKLFFLNGWKIGKGPCNNCTAADKLRDVTSKRQQLILDKHNPGVFGTWSVEIDGVSIPKTGEVNRNVKDIVFLVSKTEHWELEGSEITLDFPLRHQELDIVFKSVVDEKMSLLPNITHTLVQVKVNTGVRSDVGRPNSSPLVLIKPSYSLELGKKYKIHLPSIDRDDDAVRCDTSTYIEALGYGHFIQSLSRKSLYEIDRVNCVLSLNISSAFFNEHDTFAIPVTVKDYSTQFMTINTTSFNEFTPYRNVIGRVVVQMHFQITRRTDPPEIIPPTPTNYQMYTIYVGGDFNVNVYAKPSNLRHIVSIDFLKRDWKRVNVSGIQPAKNIAANAVYATMSWSPTEQDLGKHLVCAIAEDSQGRMTVDLHCFIIIVKKNVFRQEHPIHQGKPYYVSFPKRGDLNCFKGTICRFPVYAATDDTEGIISIVSTSDSKENVTIQYSHELIDGKIVAKVAQVEFFSHEGGPRQICLKASDRLDYTIRCLIGNIQLTDPCLSDPCQNNGKCEAFVDNTGYTCSCTILYSGKLCETRITHCPHICPAAIMCLDQPFVDHPFACICKPGTTGIKCEHLIDTCVPNPCNDSEICHQSGESYDCLPEMQPDVCTGLPNCSHTSTSTCVKNSSNTLQCFCGLGKEDDGTCKKDSNLYSSNTAFPHFVPPSPGLGAVIHCESYKLDCQFTVYVSTSEAATISLFNQKQFGILVPTVTECVKENLRQICTSVIRIDNPSHHPDSMAQEYNVCLNVARTSSPQSITDHICVHVLFEPKIWKQLTNQSVTACDFAPGTLEKGSTIGCRKGIPCHFIVYTIPHQNGTCAKLITNNEYVGVFKPVKNQRPGLCSYDVAYTNTSSIGTKQICLMPCPKGESRCYIVNVNDIQDKCSSNQCLNGGACQTLPDGELHCHCTENFWGKYCESGFCYSHSHCQNNAVCYKNRNDIKCLCPLGYTGQSCASEANKNFTSIRDNGGHFTEMALPETVTCYLDTQCTIPVSVTKNKNHMPNLVTGSMDKTLEASELSVENVSLPGGIVRGKMVVVGSEIGLKTLCLDSFGTPRNGKTEDEICFKINVIKGNYLKTNKFKPHFVSPTLANQTILQCKIHEHCHLSLWTRNKLLEENCPHLKADKKIEDGVYVFPQASDAQSLCVFDVVITVNNKTDVDLCFLLLDYKQENADKRCYTIQALPKLTVKGACVGVFCYNDGFCDGENSPAKCKCRSGFSGENCSKDTGIVQGNNSYTYGLPLFGDVALPKLIRCPLSKDCSIPFTVTNANKFNLTWNGTNIDMKNLTYSMKAVSRDFSGEALIVHSTHGTDAFCLSLKSEIGELDDNVCCNIVTDSVATADRFEDDQPHFINPSPSNGSEFTCTPGKPCHVILSMSKGNDMKCPEIKDRSKDDVSAHIFSSRSTTVCHNDVWIGSSEKDSGKTKEYCFQTSVSGVLGETRCFKVHFEPHELLKMCKNSTKCRNDAACYIINQTETCICRLGFHGPNCSDDPIENLTSIFFLGTRFTDSLLPKTVICYLSRPCQIPFTVTHYSQDMPLIVPGFTVYSIKFRKIVLTNTESSGRIINGIADIIGSSLGLANVCLDSIRKAGNVKIQDEICFEVKILNGYYNDSKNFPHFLQPTLEDNSVFHCLIGKYCHLNLWAANTLTGMICPELKSDRNFDSGVFIISPKSQVTSPCTYDAVLKKDTPATLNICFILEGNNRLPSSKRCYTIQFSSSMSVKGSCIKQSCCNGGFCDGHEPVRKCLCRVGFSGESCSSEFGIPHAMNQKSFKYPLFSNMLLPNRVNCPWNEDCKVQLLVSERNGFYITTTVDPSGLEVKEIKETPFTGDYLVTVKVAPKKTGIHQLCVNVSPDRYSIATDKVCCSISSESLDSGGIACSDVSVDDCSDPRALINICSDPTTATFCRKSCKLCDDPSTSLQNIDKTIFVDPSPTNSSTFSCSPGLECHLLLYLKQRNNSQCPDISVLPSAEILVHIFNTSDSKSCSVDILIKTFASYTGRRVDLCIQASQDDSRLSEVRCYIVEYKEPILFRQTMNISDSTTTTAQQATKPIYGNVIG